MKNLILPADPLNSSKVEGMFQSEYDAAKDSFNIDLFDQTSFEQGNKAFNKLKDGNGEKIYYHGWMMKPDVYNSFYSLLESKGFKLLNSPDQYLKCHHFNGWYELIKDYTPQSIIVNSGDVSILSDAIVDFLKNINSNLMIKDYVSSLKHYWHEACYIPKHASGLDILKVVSRFLQIKKEYNDFQGGLVVRELVNLKKIGYHNKSKLPISQEYRTFVYKGKVISTSPYWNQGKYLTEVPPMSLLQDIVDKIYTNIGNNLFTIDTAMLDNGSWICIEIGDGQVSSLPEFSDKRKFFQKLSE